MKKIRQQVFETNSSSSHSITIADETKEFILDSIFPDENGDIILTGGEFDWQWFKSNNALFKANYAAVGLGAYNPTLVEVLQEQTGGNIIFNLGEDSYIDHQSCGTCPRDKEELRNFIFNKNSWLFGGNDNGTARPDFYIVPTHTKEGIIEPNFQYVLLIADEEFKFLEYPTNEDLDNVVSSLSLRYNASKEILQKNSYYWSGGETYYDSNYFYTQKIKNGFVVLINNRAMNKLIEGKNWTEQQKFYPKFIKQNLKNSEIVYKVFFKIEKL